MDNTQLPAETLKEIKAKALNYSIVAIEARAFVAGATEWAGKAIGLIEILTEISESHCDYIITNYAKALHSTECRACKAKEALANYKEAENG